MFRSELNMNLPDVQLADLGRARQVKVTKDNTVIVDGAGDPKRNQGACSTRSKTPSPSPRPTMTKEKLQERLAKLSGGVAVIKVGAQTEVAMKSRSFASRTR